MNKDKKRRGNLPPINNNIRYKNLRLVNIDEEKGGIFTKEEALKLAEEKGLDLVMVSDKVDPPVCKIMDYGKYKYEQDKKQKEAKKKQHNVDVKEVKMSYKIGEHDYQVRVNQATKFLNGGDKVKATVTFKGREIQHSDRAEKTLKRMADDLVDLSEIQQAPKREGRKMIMMLSPKK